MELIRGFHNLRPRHRGCVLTMGNFDGLHLGHMALLSALREQAAQFKVASLVILFEPQPSEYFAHQPCARLMRFREKIIHLAKQGVDRVLCLRFDDILAKMSATDFVTKLLVDHLAVKAVWVGDDFRFGYRREGDMALMQRLGEAHHFQTEAIPTFQIANERVSSTRIRVLLEAGDLLAAGKLLGRPFSMQGRVARGDQRGRLLGFPTANIQIHRRLSPIQGVFVVSVTGLGEAPVLGVANIGIRPTVSGSHPLLEVHLFDFDRQIYGQHIEVAFLHKLRDEKKFANLEALQEQLTKDVAEAKQYFASRSNGVHTPNTI